MIASHCFNSLMTTICSFFYAQCKYDVILCESESVVCNHLSTWSLQPYICSRFLQPSKVPMTICSIQVVSISTI
ncbi:hypothetical protein MRB53_005974 [Persea americana]|uniref:Uncharacterized protein n=1 Tax=Persea americana TaxID=3435 RepID=A0ACC2MFQ2_PERAE|nr:hypothetical protein MRB53_005974 [Persea americana]